MITIAQWALIILLSLFLLFHFLVLLKIIPYSVVWGGRIKSDRQMYRLGLVSIIINALFVMVVLVQANFLSIEIPKKIVDCALWIMAGLFCLNTIGNAVSKNKFEQRVFTPVTILLTIFSVILALAN